jgi:hypothetical protein
MGSPHQSHTISITCSSTDATCQTHTEATSSSMHVEEFHEESTSFATSTQWIRTIIFRCMYRRIIKLSKTMVGFQKIDYVSRQTWIVLGRQRIKSM